MADILYRDPDLEWLDHVQPVGLVVATSVLKELGLTPLHQSPVDTAEVAEHLSPDLAGPALPDPWAFMEKVLGWNAAHVAGVPGGPELPDTLLVSLPEHGTTLEPTWAVAELGQNGQPWQLLIRVEAAGIEPDGRAQLDGWEASPHQRFERLLKDAGVFAGLLVTDRELRLVYAPRGETSGYLSFPLRPLGMVAGRPMLGGLKLLLDSFRLFSDADERRLPALLKKSRDAQASVSTELAGQVLGALHELLRGLDAADAAMIRDLARSNPGHVYEGLLTVLMRLVFILYAEDRDLLPSLTDARARAIYESSYSVRGLYAKLVEDAALNPDTMDERRGGWGQLLALFRLIHKGHPSHFVQARGGKLFDPEEFPFLEGRASKDDPPRILNVSDGCILRILEGLMTLKLRGQERQRLSYRTLDVEQIGSVYETVMGFTVEVAESRVLAIKAGKNNRTPVFVALDELLKRKGKDRIKDLKENVGRSLTAAQAKPVEAATTVEDLAAALDGVVDERGSPRHVVASPGTPILQPTDERRRTGSHYTPRSLTQPIVAHALEPAFERLGPDATPEQILELKVCDPAMGSGAFLVEACRAIAARLVKAWERWPATRPVIPPGEDEELHARRLVAQRCLYGVDKNPRAVDLAKLSLWLATLAKDHEFTFLDHALKCGDSLVGLTPEQIAAANWDSSKPGLPLLRPLVAERVAEADRARAEIRSAPDDTMRAMQEQRHKHVETRLSPVRLLGDAVIAAFFSADKAKAREKARADAESWFSGRPARWDLLEASAKALREGAYGIPPFHWAVEFPEVFRRENGGFDAIIGNPPFMGGRNISGNLGKAYLSWLFSSNDQAGGQTDLVAYFFRVAFGLIRKGGALGFISTNTISQGDTRRSGLTWICNNSGNIYNVVKRYSWPGEAAVVVSIVHIAKHIVPKERIVDGRTVQNITSYLVHTGTSDEPRSLVESSSMAFKGQEPYGKGFQFADNEVAASPISEMHRLIEEDARNQERIFPYIGGAEVLGSPTQAYSRFIISFDDMSEAEARLWPALFSICEEKVASERSKKAKEVASWPFWTFWRTRAEMRRAKQGLTRILFHPFTSAHLAFAFLPVEHIVASPHVVIALDGYGAFAVLQSRVHEVWARFFSSSMKDDLRYAPSDCFRTFAFPASYQLLNDLREAGQSYYEYRAELLVSRDEGLTKTYNRFHHRGQNAPDIARLRELHAEMDAAVLRAYGWDDLAERAQPEFIEQHADEGKQAKTRLDWPSEFKDEVLARLLALNAERAEAERAAGLTASDEEDEDEDDDVDDE
ncbi:N-6 DNA methylase [Albimonas sp. CAU 1670]|uniref:Eco57I restriction-modification methylase domain-containing protein n=1 Tax=Albimonas sp. CAU 1670 TaxID=3032599 RepID=UPI0023DC8A3E|nr:DNA methyltransferase [Albimonas sp. CAU 1670]MDF2235104.1 N-6 DNA methylase [Albimonas sp. CAU 1670]